ncbi:MAG: hypothetical protein AAB617_01835 [Patescibacteria group bacterium]
MKRNIFIFSFILTACSLNRIPGSHTSENKAVLVVENSNTHGVTLYLCRDSADCNYRFGQIMSIGRKETFNIPSSFMTSPVRVRIVVFASSEHFMTNSVHLSSGDTAILNVEHYLPYTSLYIMSRGGR